MTLYQVKGSTVTFTNESTQTGDVTSWTWQQQINGGGWTATGISAPNPEVSADVTFSNNADDIVDVRLVASGTWGSDVIYQEQFVMVETNPAPSIETPTFARTWKTGIPQTKIMSLAAGTGAGVITWSLINPPPFCDITSGGLLTFRPPIQGTHSIMLKAVDQLGREDTLVFDISAATLSTIFNAEYGVTKDVNDKVSRWQIAGNAPDDDFDLQQPTGANQPTYNAQDATFNNKPSITFTNVCRLYASVNFASDLNVLFIIKIPDSAADLNGKFLEGYNENNLITVASIGGVHKWACASNTNRNAFTNQPQTGPNFMLFNNVSSNYGFYNMVTGTYINGEQFGATGVPLNQEHAGLGHNSALNTMPFDVVEYSLWHSSASSYSISEIERNDLFDWFDTRYGTNIKKG